MKLKRLSIGTLGLLAVSGFAWSCSSKSEDCAANLSCAPYDGGAVGHSGASGAASASGSSGTSGSTGGLGGMGGSSSSGFGNSSDGGTDANAGSGGAAPPACDGSLSPDADGCVISDEYGLFVSPAGSDADGKGTQAAPFATVTRALANIDKIKHVYVCAGDYVEPETLEIPDRVSIYGGFSCDAETWKYDSSFPAHLVSARPIAATITDAKVGVVIQDLRLDAANAPEDGTGANSFGLMITGSQGVALKRVEIRAGKGGKGGNGLDGATGLDGVASGDAQNGAPGSCANPPAFQAGAQSVSKICESQGGVGGTAFAETTDSKMQAGSSGYLVSPSNGGDAGKALGDNGQPGYPGGNGLRGEIGASAATVGAFSATGYKVASGGNGGLGKPGQGGGGGGASLGVKGSTTTCIGAAGAAGGMGGCGGDPGTGGIGGGASVALFSWQSAVSIDGCKLVANTGGAGGDAGKGHIGGAGKAGGIGGPADKDAIVGKGGNGGEGGRGGSGGNGAGGTGGPSIALVYDGTPVTQVTPATLSFAMTPSAAGKGGTLGQPADYGPDGSKGLAQDIYPKQQ